jgi:predicted phosphodiesterase
MRFAIISDIHGNFVALKAALSDIKGRKASQIICLGDVAATGPQPAEVIGHLRKMRCPCVMGNTDEKLAKDLPSKFAHAGVSEEDRKRQEALDAWTRKNLTKSHRHYLSTFKPTLEVHLGPDQSLLCYHGSPSSNRDEIMPTTPNEELTRQLEGQRANVFAGAHTHIQMFRPFLNSLLINPGSVGWPFRIESSGNIRYPSIAEYAIVSSSSGTLSVELVSVQYSLSELRRAVRTSGMPNPDWWLSDWV